MPGREHHAARLGELADAVRLSKTRFVTAELTGVQIEVPYAHDAVLKGRVHRRDRDPEYQAQDSFPAAYRTSASLFCVADGPSDGNREGRRTNCRLCPASANSGRRVSVVLGGVQPLDGVDPALGLSCLPRWSVALRIDEIERVVPRRRGRSFIPPGRQCHGANPATIARAWTAQDRLSKRFAALAARKNVKSVVAAAVARELAGSLWAETTATTEP